MTFKELGLELKRHRSIFKDLLWDLPEAQMRWKPAPDRWSLLVVVHHLLDEEREDFRQALMSLMENPRLPWPEIDPMGWVESRKYNQADPTATLQAFLSERDSSLEWVDAAGEPDLSIAHAGEPTFDAPMTIGDTVVSWVAHDFFHIRQIVNLKWEYLATAHHPYDCGYAGEY